MPRWVWLSSCLFIAIVAAVSLAAVSVVLQVSQLLAATETNDAGWRSGVDATSLQRDLHDQLSQFSHRAIGASSNDYLRKLIAATVEGVARPDLLVGMVRLRASPGTPPTSMLLERLGRLQWSAAGLVQLDFPGEPSAFPSGIRLCLQIQELVPIRLRLVALVWPERPRAC